MHFDSTVWFLTRIIFTDLCPCRLASSLINYEMYFCCTLLKYFAFICGSVCAEFTNFMSKVFMSNTKYLWTTAALHIYNSYDVGYLRNVIKHWNRNWNIVVAMSLPSFLLHFWFGNTLKIFAIPSLDNLGQHFIFFDTKTIFYFNSFCLFLGKFVKNYSFSLVLCHYFVFFLLFPIVKPFIISSEWKE